VREIGGKFHFDSTDLEHAANQVCKRLADGTLNDMEVMIGCLAVAVDLARTHKIEVSRLKKWVEQMFNDLESTPVLIVTPN
jgi:hypothetical protein